MDPKVGQIWEWDIDRKDIRLLRIKQVILSVHNSEVICEILEGIGAGTEFQTSIGSFTNPNWRLIDK
jgi:hypothetical protein